MQTIQFEEVPNLPGMFTLGTNEQIEIREIVQVTLDSPNTNLYWEISDVASTVMIGGRGRIDFPWNEEPIHPDTGEKITVTAEMEKGTDYIFSAYTLKEGEYLYYTDMNKSDIAFYGFGSTIRRNINTPAIFKYTSDDVISTEDISTSGLSAAIPWRKYNLSNEKAALTIMENQFINLTAGAELTNIDLKSDITAITNDYVDVESYGASWKTTEKDSINNLPMMQLKDTAQYGWQVRSRLNIAMSPTKYQTLKTKAIPNSDEYITDSFTLISTEISPDTGTEVDTETITLKAKIPDAPLSIKSNKIVQSAITVTDVSDKEVSIDGIVENIYATLQLKLFETAPLKSNIDQFINIGNYGDKNFTSINMEEHLNQATAVGLDSQTTPVEISLNALIPPDNFGLLMIYYQNLNPDAPTNKPSIKATKDALSIFNDGNTEELAHSNELSPVRELKLKPGINIIKITAPSSHIRLLLVLSILLCLLI